MQKIIALTILFVVSVIHPVKDNKNYEINNNSITNKLDSLSTIVNKDGWDNSLLSTFRFHLLNSTDDFNKERDAVSKLPVSFEKTFLYSLVLKREKKYNEMFDSLFSILDHSPDYLYYYEELSLASFAANRQSLVASYLGKQNLLKPNYSNYLQALYNLSNSNPKVALPELLAALKSDPDNSRILYQLSIAYRDLGDYPNALNTLVKSLENNNDKYQVPENLLAQGTIFYLSGKTDKAEKYYKDALKKASEMNDRHFMSRSLVDLGIIYDIKGNSKEARINFNNAIKIADEIRDPDSQALACSELGVSLSFTNNLIEAKNNYLKSYQIYKLLGNRGRLSLLSDNIAKIYMTMFDYNSALKYYNEGVQFAGDNKRAHILNLIGLADVYSNLSNYTKAIDYYKEAQVLSGQIDELALNATIKDGLGILNYSLDNIQNALVYFNSSKELNQKSGYVYMEADADHKIGVCLMKIDSLTNAGEYLSTAEVNARKAGDNYLDALCLTDLSLLYVEMNDPLRAAEFIKKARAVTAKGKFDYLDNRIELLSGDISNNFNDAKLHYTTALSIAKKINDFDLQIEACNSLAKLFEKNNLNEAADSYYKSAINLVDDISRPLFKSEDVQISYFSSKHDVYSSYGEFLLKQKDYVRAFNMIDKSRSRNLMQNLTNIKLQSLIKDEKSLNLLYEYDWMIQSGVYDKHQLDSIRLQYSLLKKDLIASNKELSKYLDNQTGISVNDIQEKLNTGENILSIYCANNNTYLFLINKNEFKTFETGVSKSEVLKLLSRISPYYNREMKNPVSFYNQDLFSFNAEASNEFYDKILKSALYEIPKQEKIIIIPAYELVVLPFDFIVSGFNKESSSYSYEDKHFLIYDYDFSYSTSASAFILERANHLPNNNTSLVVGYPSIDPHINGYAERRGLLDDNPGDKNNFTLLPLRYSKDEVSEIGNIIKADKVLTDKNATETNFKKNAELMSIIHLSTHSFLFNKQPVIFFSNVSDPDNDGFLEANEIVKLKLNSDLVVLSSCNSGLGKIDESEGIIGMSKAFFEAGTKSIVVSLWEVNDKYTSHLMTLFYSKLSRGLDKSEALRQAKIEFIKEYSPNPYYWGAFVLSGDISKLPLKHQINSYYLVIGIIAVILVILVLLPWKFKSVKKA